MLALWDGEWESRRRTVQGDLSGYSIDDQGIPLSTLLLLNISSYGLENLEAGESRDGELSEGAQ